MLKWVKISSLIAVSAMVGATAGVAVEKHFFENRVVAVQQTTKHVTHPKQEKSKPKPQPKSEQSETQSKPKQEQQQEPKNTENQTDNKSQEIVHKAVSDGPTKRELRTFWNKMLDLKSYLDMRWDGNEYALISPVEGNALLYIKTKLENIHVPDDPMAKKYHMVFLDDVSKALIAVQNAEDRTARRIINRMDTELQLLFPDEYKPLSD